MEIESAVLSTLSALIKKQLLPNLTNCNVFIAMWKHQKNDSSVVILFPQANADQTGLAASSSMPSPYAGLRIRY
jgi:hypothetical protein